MTDMGKIRVGDTMIAKTRSGETIKGVIQGILLREEASGKRGIEVEEVDKIDVNKCIFDIGSRWVFGDAAISHTRWVGDICITADVR